MWEFIPVALTETVIAGCVVMVEERTGISRVHAQHSSRAHRLLQTAVVIGAANKTQKRFRHVDSNASIPWLKLLEIFTSFCRLQSSSFEFLKLSRKLPDKKISLILFIFIKLPIRCISNLAAISSRNVLQVSLSSGYNFRSN